ncbi:MAG: folate-binding protein YgfZ [SAR86 cluster bacterium]|uniref:Folate-binding protein YgfZ n=1 Tax=SAR86 cluster bacterium TaxID=2030880 RepID=A0A2A4WZZ2_9GAMM|nr:MAG: folate-binding protein YgfZ [SAR86 cluster bacterium]
MQNNIYSLESYEFIRISGADSISFLQGQLSCNTELLSAGRSLTGALCNLKGRVIADFRLVKIGEDIIMQCAAGMADKIHATLSKYAVFSKVELSLLESKNNTAPVAIGVIGKGVDEALSILGLDLPENTDGVSSSPSSSVVRVSGLSERIEIWMHTEAAAEQLLTRLKEEKNDDLEPWLRADIEAGIVHVTPTLSEEFTPQLLNYDLSGLIDFKKGCYTGQEIVARMFYRGTAKRRLQLASSSHSISDSSKVVARASEDSGEDILAFSNTGATESLLLAVLAVQAVDSGERMTLSDNAESEVCIRELPYMTN